MRGDQTSGAASSLGSGIAESREGNKPTQAVVSLGSRLPAGSRSGGNPGDERGSRCGCWSESIAAPRLKERGCGIVCCGASPTVAESLQSGQLGIGPSAEAFPAKRLDLPWLFLIYGRSRSANQ